MEGDFERAVSDLPQVRRQIWSQDLILSRMGLACLSE